MKQDVAAFMEEGEPEVIVGFISATELYEGLFRCEPTSGAAHMRISELRSKAHRHSAFHAFLLKCAFDLLQIVFTCQFTETFQRCPELISVVGRARYLFRL